MIYREAKHLKRSLLTSKMFKIGNVSKDESKRRKETEEEGRERERRRILEGSEFDSWKTGCGMCLELAPSPPEQVILQNITNNNIAYIIDCILV